MNKFRIGDRIENIDPRDDAGDNYGEEGFVTDIDNTYVYVEYDNGTTGKSKVPEKYYQIISDRNARVNGARATSNTNTHMTPIQLTPIQSVLSAVKRALMSTTEKALIDSGLKDACGTYTPTAIAILAQSAAAADVALGTDSVLIAAANAVMAEKKENKNS